jgi:hypothetical protein
MKFVALLLPAITLLFSCSRTHEVYTSEQVIIANDLIGKWAITEFADSGIDKTADVSVMTLQFNSTGEFLIFNNDSLFDGSWELIPEVGLDKLRLSVKAMHTPYSLFDITWYVFDKTTSSIHLSSVTLSHERAMTLRRI